MRLIVILASAVMSGLTSAYAQNALLSVAGGVDIRDLPVSAQEDLKGFQFLYDELEFKYIYEVDLSTSDIASTNPNFGTYAIEAATYEFNSKKDSFRPTSPQQGVFLRIYNDVVTTHSPDVVDGVSFRASNAPVSFFGTTPYLHVTVIYDRGTFGSDRLGELTNNLPDPLAVYMVVPSPFTPGTGLEVVNAQVRVDD